MSNTTVTVRYRSPEDRANLAAKRAAINSLIAWLMLAIPLLVTFLNVGDFSQQTLTALAIAILTSALNSIVAWLRQYQLAEAEDNATDPLP